LEAETTTGNNRNQGKSLGTKLGVLRSALIMYLNEDADPWIRTVRAVNAVVNGYENSGGRNNESPYSEATADHLKMKQAFASQGMGNRRSS